MTTRILTLFDDESFFPQEEPKKKTVNEKPVVSEADSTDAEKEVSTTPVTEKQNNESETYASSESSLPEEGAVAENEAAVEEELNDAILDSDIKVEETGTIVIIEPATAADEEDKQDPLPKGNSAEIVSEIARPEGQEAKDEQENNDEVKAADQELNTQILTELIQLDYTSFIHREYPFEAGGVVINKDKEIGIGITYPEKKNDLPEVGPEGHPETGPEAEKEEWGSIPSDEKGEALSGVEDLDRMALTTESDISEGDVTEETLDEPELLGPEESPAEIAEQSEEREEGDSRFEKDMPLMTEDLEEEDMEDEVFEDIVPLPDWNLDKKYYSIGEVAQLFSVNTSHIRFWTNEFKLKPRTTRKGDRLYNPKDIADLRLIHHLVKEKKHTIKGAREKLKAGKEDVNNKLDLKDALVSLRDMLRQIREQL